MMMCRCSCVVFMLLATATGCSQGVSIKTVPVTGKVTLNGQPLAGASVTFVADTPDGAATAPPPATGITGADGSYKMVTMASGRQVVDGVPPGNYKVVITKQSTPAATSPAAGMEGLSDEERAKKMQSMSPEERAKMAGSPATKPGQAAAAPRSGVPARYGKPNDSGLTATVAASGAQTFDFPLTDE